jgi:hypothetical protein
MKSKDAEPESRLSFVTFNFAGFQFGLKRRRKKRKEICKIIQYCTEEYLVIDRTAFKAIFQELACRSDFATTAFSEKPECHEAN